MARLQVVKLMRREAMLSEELRHLLKMCVTQAQQVFEEVCLIEVEPPAVREEVGFDPGITSLILGEADVLVAASSLRAMRSALAGGSQVAVASPVHRFAEAAAGPIHSLYEFEAVERAILSEPAAAAEAPRTHLPVALGSVAWLRRVAAGGSVERLLTDSGLLEGCRAGVAAVSSGVYFELADYYGQRREDILPLLPQRAGHVLEVGCGRGITGRMVGERLGCPVVGVELNPEIAEEAAARLEEVVVGDALDVAIEGCFDVIIATEVLEHVDDTDAFLQRMRELLAPGGRLILSVPNVGHYSVVAALVRGRWDYVPAGVLCVTHRRFFTRASLTEALQRAGLAALEIRPQTTELPDDVADLVDWPGADEQSLRTLGFLVACTR